MKTDPFWSLAVAEHQECDHGGGGAGQVRTAKLLPVLTMVPGYSRRAPAVLIPARGAEDLSAGWRRLIQGPGAVPRLLVRDGEGAIGRHPDKLTAGCQAFRGTPATRVCVCRAADPEAEGLAGRFHDYLERPFLPGRVPGSPAGFSARLPGRPRWRTAGGGGTWSARRPAGSPRARR